MATEPSPSTGSTADWTMAPLVALDLEGSGAQDRDSEAILEIAVVPLTAGQPDTSAAYTTLVNPGRRIPRRPWISPGLTNAALAAAPAPAEVEPELACRINRRYLVGHNIGVDWRLLHLLLPALITRAWPDGATLGDLLTTAAIDPAIPSPARTAQPVTQDTLFDPAR